MKYDDDKDERGEGRVDDEHVVTLLRGNHNAPRRTVCGVRVPELDAALRHDRRETRLFAPCQPPGC